MSEICKFRRGGFPQPYTNSSYYDGEESMPFVQVGDIQEDGLKLFDTTKKRISKLAQKDSLFLKEGSLIVSLQGSIGRVALTQYDCYIDRTICYFYDYDENIINKKYLAYQLQRSFEKAAKNARGGILKTIVKEEFGKFEIVLPSLETQQKIVDILDKFSQLKNQLKNEIELRNKQYKYYLNKLLTFENI